ncbi:hypothetical protein GCM10027446_27220 [Angustibacter peucedani]
MTDAVPSPAGRRRVTPWALALVAVAAVLLVGTAALGPSAAEPSLGAGSGWRATLPPWSLTVGPSSGLVTVLLDLGYLFGGAGVGLGLWAAARGERVPALAVRVAVVVAVLAVVVPPLGSADHVSYAAYGRIAAAGGDPYTVEPVHWAGGHDPVTSAVEPPWTTTPSVYGPVATAVQALTSRFGGDSLRATVWAWQLVCLAAWLTIGWLLVRLCRSTSARATWLWLLNPVLLGVLLVGAHVDVLGAALALGAIALSGRRPLLAGVLLGAAVGVKITFAVVGPAVLVALWRRRRGGSWRPAGLGVLGALLVLVPAHAWAGTHLVDQLARARRYVSLATPWRPFVDWLTGPLSNDAVRQGVVVLTPVVVLALAALLWLVVQRTAPWPRSTDDEQVALDAARVTVVLGAAYVLGAPYSLPWYDAVAWAPLALVAVPAIDVLLLVRLVTYAAAYVPGRVLGSSPRVEDLTLTYRREVTPWLGLGLWLALGLLAARRPRARAGSPRSPAGSRG